MTNPEGSNSNSNSQYASRAYTLFLSELQSHLCAAQDALSSKPNPGETEIVEISQRFHKVKGGAGFFGLIEIEEVAAKLEALSAQPIQEVIEGLSETKGLLQDLEDLIKNMHESGNNDAGGA